MDEGIVEKVRAAGGEIYAITSEPQHLADQAHEHWGLNFENVGDPHQEIARTCSERGWLTLYANRGDLEFLQRGANWKLEHPKGYFQPGVLAVTSDKRLLYRWRSIPSAENMQGTLARPTADYVWNAIEGALAADTAIGDAALDDDPVVDSTPAPWPLFVAALLANGWFLGVKSMVYSPGLDLGPTRMPRIMGRWLLFAAFWVSAFLLLPAPLVGVALVAWFVWVMRDMRQVMGKARLTKELLPGKN
ncbi:MAG: hypothetical protein AAGE43_16080 [Pseudomonadota bacterium]